MLTGRFLPAAVAASVPAMRAGAAGNQNKPSGRFPPLFSNGGAEFNAERNLALHDSRGCAGASAGISGRAAECWLWEGGRSRRRRRRTRQAATAGLMVRRECHRLTGVQRVGVVGLGGRCSGSRHQPTCVSRRSDRVASPRGEGSQPLSIAGSFFLFPRVFPFQVFFIFCSTSLFICKNVIFWS